MPEFPVELLHLFFAVCGGRQGDSPIRMQVVNMAERKEAVQGSVNGSGNRILAKGAQRILLHHFIFACNSAILLLKRAQLVEVQSGKALALDAAQVAPTALHPKEFSGFA